jgi:hypothetical protein
MILATAVNGGADVVVTFNMRHLAIAVRVFGIWALRPAEAWREVQNDETK